MLSGLTARLSRITYVAYHEGPAAAWRSASIHKVKQHVKLVQAGWRPRGDRVTDGKAWLPLDQGWQIAVLLEQLTQAGCRFANAGADEFIVVTSGGSQFLSGRTEILDVLGAVYERFVLREYEPLDARGAVVIDVGAYVADSAIFFARAGAKKVYAFEPFAATYAAAVRNVALNHLEDVIEVRKVGLGAEGKTVTGTHMPRTPMLSTTTDSGPVEHSDGEAVQIVTLASAVDGIRRNHPGDRLVLKIDCEGAEFDFLTSASEDALRELDQLMVEYHYRSPAPIEDVIRAAGLSIVESGAGARVEQGGEVGMIFATRRLAPVSTRAIG